MTITSEQMIGQLPSHWEVRPIQFCCDSLVGFPFSSERFLIEPLGTPLLRGDNITTGYLRWGERSRWWDHSNAAFSKYQLSPNDIVIGMDGSKVGRNYAMVTEGDLPLLLVQRVTRLRPKSRTDARYILYCVMNERFHAHVDLVRTDPAIPHITLKDILSFKIPFPPFHEQQAISAYLDRKTAQIDTLIAKKQRLIELLQEKRQALISRAVTKGLNPNMPMKDSGVEWLGMIPQHWHAVRLKYVTYIQSGITLGKSYDGCDVVSRPYLRVANVQDGFLDLSEITYINLPTNDVGRYELRNGDVLMTEGGDFDKLGRGYVWRNEVVGCLHQNHVFAVRPDQRHLLPEFLASLMTSSHGKNHFTSTSQQTTNLATTNRTKLGDFVLPLPSVVEQIRIIKHVQRSSQHLQLIGRKLTDQITKLQEYRQTLISAAVTGKIDVRKEAHP